MAARHAGILCLLLAAAACATVEKNKLAKVRRVAIVGFEGRIEEGGGHLNEFAQAVADQQFGPKLYKILQRQLKAGMGWNVVPRDKLIVAAKNRGIAKSKSGKAMAALNYKNKKILIPGILDPAMAAGLIKKHGRALARELDVDAFMTVSFNVSADERSKSASEKVLTKINGNAAQVHLLECNLSLTLQRARDGAKIWYEPGIVGKTSDSAVAKYYGIPLPKPKQRAVVSACTNALDEHISSVK